MSAARTSLRHDRANAAPDAIDSAAAAWARGLAAGDAAWLARAARLAPDDPRITLDLARVRLGGSSAEVALAAAALERLAARHDVLAAWVGLVLARHRLGDAAGAAAALEKLLARHCVPAEPGFAALALRVSQAAGYGGFCGMAADGALVSQGAGRLLGADGDFSAFNRTEGLVTMDDHGLRGWATRLAAQDTPPEITLTDATGRRRAIKFSGLLPVDEQAPFQQRHGFTLSLSQLRGLTPPFALHGPESAQLLGSPVDPAILAIPPAAASKRGAPVARIPPRRPLAIIIPLYRGLAETKACLDALLAALPVPRPKLILVDDSSPEPALSAFAAQFATTHKAKLIRHAENHGFAAAVNSGLQVAGRRDILLLNSDTLMPKGAITALHNAAYAEPDTGTLSPFSNEATILSYPNPQGGNPAPDLPGTQRLHTIAARANGSKTAEIPTAIGFCMLIRQDCLEATGAFRPEIFAQGYGEENDFCIRARHLGFRHRAALGVYVAHIGGVSFRAAARGLVARNLTLLNRFYPGYHALVMEHITSDPLAPARARMDAQRLRSTRNGRDSVLLISHSHGGGVARQVQARMAALRAQGLRPLLLTTLFPAKPDEIPYPWPALLTEGGADDTPNLTFPLPAARTALLRTLKSARVTAVELHHMLGHHPEIRTLAATLGVPQTIIIHDYAAFCRRVNLLTRAEDSAPPRYCGEPSPAGCIACCEKHADELFDPLSVPDLLRRSAAELAAAHTVIAPSADAARRMARHFPGISPQVTPWEDDAAAFPLQKPGPGPRRRIAIIGGIGPSKGFDILLDCARDAAARNLPLDFVVAGASADDAQLLETGRIFVTGAYAEGEATALITSLGADLAFLPSIWPETWCFTLTEAWRAGLYAVTFDLGAQAARIKATRRGLTLPLGLPVSRINDRLLGWMP